MELSTIILQLVISLLICSVRQTQGQTAQNYLYKSLAGPPSDFPSFTPPTFEDAGMHSRYYVLPSITLENPIQKWTHSFPVDHCEIFAVTLFAEEIKTFTVKFVLPSGTEITANEIYNESIGYGAAGLYPCMTFLFSKPIPSVGEWSITVNSNSSSYPVNASLIASFYPSDLILQAFVPTENLVVGRSVNIIASFPVSVGLGKSSNSTTSVAMLENAIAVIYLPDGSNKTLKLEEGLSHSIRNIKSSMSTSDLYASFETTIAGVYKNLVQVNGKLSDGTNFIRSLWYVFTVAHPSIEIIGKVKGSLRTHDTSQRDIIDLNIDVNWDGSDGSYRAFAEVYATGENNRIVPVAWISGLVDVQRRTGCLFDCHYVQMHLDSRWLELANATPPLILTKVTLEDLKAFITLSKMDALDVIADDKLMTWLPSLKAEDIEIDWEMKEGYNPYRMKEVDNVTEDGQLLLLHGYCATGNGFPLKHFDDYLLFEDYGKNYFHDEYARKAYDFVTGTRVTSAYGHSQGGAVALHLYTYYMTGLDSAEGRGIIIQSIGTPYRGSPLSGILAFLAELLFGYGCGYNENLTYSGAERWLSKIPSDKRSDVFYYTTQYPKDAPLFQRYCWLATLLVLSPDNDGIVEVSRGLLPGGYHVENAEGECHVCGMRYPPQLSNIERSKGVNAIAAR